MKWYRVQIGAYKLKRSAEKVSVDLIEKGFKTSISKEGLLYKVRVGSFQDKSKAEKLLARVHEHKKYRKAKILEWNDGKDLPIIDLSENKEANRVLAMIENRYLDRDDANEMVVKDFNALADKVGKPHMKDSSAWCTETLVSAFNLCGLLDLVGYATSAPELKKNAKERGTWISGTPDHYEPGDICVYQSDAGDPNHVEISIDQEWNYTGNRNGGCHKRKKTDRHSKLHGVIRPKYKTKEQSYHPAIKFVAPWFTETCESKFGDAEFFIEYEKNGIDISFVILVDTGMYGCDTIKKLKKFGVKSNTPIYVVISHGHGDHYGYLDIILKEFNVVHLYLPGIDGLRKYQPSYAKAIQKQEKKAKKKGIPVTYLTTAGYFEVGHIRCDCVYQVPAERLPEHDGHKFVNNQSILTLFTLDRHGRVLLTGDLSNPGNKIVMSRVASELLAADICKCGWHGDGNAMTTEWAKYIGAPWWFWNYPHNESRGGRGNTRKKIEKAGYSVLRNYEDGDIWFDYCDGEFVLNTSKKTFKDVKFKSRFR